MFTVEERQGGWAVIAPNGGLVYLFGRPLVYEGRLVYVGQIRNNENLARSYAAWKNEGL